MSTVQCSEERLLNMKKSNGYVIYEDTFRVVIATGFKTKSANIKTGNMIQIWILVKSENPVSAIKSGLDELVCGDCPLRGEICYVNVGQAPLAIWRSWENGNYGYAGKFDGQGWVPDKAMLRRLFQDRSTRFGAYGDPVWIPMSIVRIIAAASKNWTGYTHQWKNPLLQGYKTYFMASADTVELKEKAHDMGWRTFRVADIGEEPSFGEIVCPNTTHGVQCEKCGLCQGAAKKSKSIVITVHGSKKKNFTKVRSEVRNINYTVTV
tara:strand:+ start:487 stop:1281 length:795 start_codon:yes stop_codon:yes gene_type:complete